MEEDLQILETKVNQLKMAYDRYFLGTRPREPVNERSEVERSIVIFSNTAIQNTAMRFKFTSINSRYQAHKRQWNETLRQIEQGTYKRHRFKADLHERQRQETVPAAGASGIFEAYRDARLACGQGVKTLSREKLEAMLEKQRAQLQQRFGKDAKFKFRVVVEDGKVKLKASRLKSDAA